MAKNRPGTIRFSSDGTDRFFIKFFKNLYNNIIELNKGYKSIYLFPNLGSVKKIFRDFNLRAF